MKVPAPHFLLMSEAHWRRDQGEWRFVLRSLDGSHRIEAKDREPQARGNRLELLALVRGLEALDQPSRVTLMTRSSYVERGLSVGIDEWRQNGWTWEYFGQMTPIKNQDLWRRVDRAMAFHVLEVLGRRFDPRMAAEAGPCIGKEPGRVAPRGARSTLRQRWRRTALRIRRGVRNGIDASKLAYAQLGGPLSPAPWLG